MLLKGDVEVLAPTKQEWDFLNDQSWRSLPHHAGTRMTVTSDGQFCSSVSGGCVEHALIAAALDSIKMDPARLMHFGVIDIFVQPLVERANMEGRQ